MWAYGLSILAGVLLFLAHPKTSYSFLAFFGLAFALEAQRLNPRRSFSLAFLTGFCYFFGLLYWLTGVMTEFGGLMFPAALGVLALLCAYLSLYLAVPLWLSQKIGLLRASPLNAIFFAALLTAFEFLRAKVPIAFPWGYLGATQYQNLFLLQIASLGGIYAVSFVLFLCNYGAFALLSQQRAIPTLALVALVLVGAYVYGARALEQKSLQGTPQRIAIIQGNIPQNIKWDPKFQRETVAKYLALSQKVLKEKPEVIIWPETALPFFFNPTKELSQQIISFAKENRVPLIFGAPRVVIQGDEPKVFNSLFLLDKTGLIKGIYDKQRLVPFGEFIPFEKELPFLRTFAVASGDYSPGIASGPLALSAKEIFGPLICFESVFPDLARRQAKDGATILLVATNDAWFRTSAGPYQHFAQAVFRAVENRRYLVRVANTGISGLIDPFGHIIMATPLEKEASLCIKAEHLSFLSWYTKHGDVFAVLCSVLSLLAGLKYLGRRKK
ncbi:apolipoprotein N-acyltransferase [Thermodesulfatator atlanticus]|uniref:apolipoprotein N-acyltransferase n=1 Tax=Thermodesulfatator atlanticus TaxID=501497 RepID=UPI0003B3C0D9|nr:apolipoprotein N-acyltransferase [Thermodesulfatator atlanticus]